MAADGHMALRVVQSLHGPSNSSLHLKDRDLTNPQAIPSSGETFHEKMVGVSLGPALLSTSLGSHQACEDVLGVLLL